jgi:hypothetical protein
VLNTDIYFIFLFLGNKNMNNNKFLCLTKIRKTDISTKSYCNINPGQSLSETARVNVSSCSGMALITCQNSSTVWISNCLSKHKKRA